VARGSDQARLEAERARRSWAAGLYRFVGEEVFLNKPSKAEAVLGFISWLPSRFVYWCAVHVWAVATTGRYGKYDATNLTASEAIARYARVKGIPGHGRDRHHDSNRRRRKKDRT
jgi:hypothetical protein